MAQLYSQWGNLSKHLLMTVFPVEMLRPGDSRSYAPVRGGDVVAFPIAPGGELRQQQNWTSPFENMTPDATLDTFGKMLQVGGFNPVMQALEKTPLIGGFSKAFKAAQGEAAQLIGATSVTKFNSTQIYSGSPPLSLSVTALFRAHKDAKTEVRDPVNQLWSWMMPKKLAGDLALTNLLNGAGPVASFYPSRAPQIVGVSYGGMTLQPMVIEAIGQPLDEPMDKDGQFVSAQIQLHLTSLTGLDADDWRAARSR